MSIFSRIFSSRVRHLERELTRVSNDFEALTKGEFEKLSVTQMVYTPENGLQAHFEGNIAKVLAGWAFNTLDCADAVNYMEFQVRHPESGAITITVQRTRGETPGGKAAKFEALLRECRDLFVNIKPYCPVGIGILTDITNIVRKIDGVAVSRPNGEIP